MSKVRILFTKELSKEYIQPKLGADFEVSFLKVIDTFPISQNIDITGFQHFIFTSIQAVKAIEGKINFPKEAKFYTVGNKSTQALQALGYEVAIEAKNAKDLSQEIKDSVNPDKILHFCSSKALDTLREELNAADFDYQQVIVYKTEACYPVFEGNVDAIVFFSPSGVESFMKNNKVKEELLFTIGETTQNALLHFTDNKIIKSTGENLDDLLGVIKATYNG